MILIVDDDRQILDMLAKMLSSEGFESLTVDSADKALQAIEQYNFSLYLIDYNLPNSISGDLLAKEIKKLDSSAKIVLITGFIFKNGYGDWVDFLIKPFSKTDLIKKVKEYVQHRG